MLNLIKGCLTEDHNADNCRDDSAFTFSAANAEGPWMDSHITRGLLVFYFILRTHY